MKICLRSEEALLISYFTVRKMKKSSLRIFLNLIKYTEVCSFLRVCLHLLKKSLTLYCGKGVILAPPPHWLSFSNSKTVKAVTLTFSNISLETFVSNLVSLTLSSFQILSKTQMGIFPISGFQVVTLDLNCHNSRARDDIDMKLMDQ